MSLLFQKIKEYRPELKAAAACLSMSNLINFFVFLSIIVTHGIDWFVAFGEICALLGLLFTIVPFNVLISASDIESHYVTPIFYICAVMGLYFTLYVYTFYVKSVLITVLSTVSIMFPVFASVYGVNRIIEAE